MPSLGADMEVGTLTEWLVRPGDQVRKGDIVAVVETDKSTVEVECFDTGTVGELLVEPGTRVPVGTTLATITEAGPALAPERAAAPRVVPPAAAPEPVTGPARPSAERRPRRAPRGAPAPQTGKRAPTARPKVSSPLIRHLAHQRGVELETIRGTGPAGEITREDVERATPARVKASPLARRLAAELGVDLATVTGSGYGVVVRAEDVRTAAEAARQAVRESRPTEAVPPDRTASMRQAIARAMSRSNREIPHYYLADTVDLTRALEWTRQRNRKVPVKDRLIPSALLLKAAALALREVPSLNGFWIDDAFVPAGGVHLGVAISLGGGGLIAPALHDADDLPLPELMSNLRDLVARARAGRLRGSELTDATITVTNLGDQGVESVHGVIYSPQVALVGFGAILERPWAIDGAIAVRPVVSATLAADHRATDGYTGGRYLQAVARLLQRPEELS